MNPVTSQAIGCRQTLTGGVPPSVVAGGTGSGDSVRGSQITATSTASPPQTANDSRQSTASAIGTARIEAIAAPPVMKAV